MGNFVSRRKDKSEPSPKVINDGPTEPKIPRKEPSETTSPQDQTKTGNSTNNTGYEENTDPATRRGEATSPDHSTSPQTTKVTADGQPVPTPTMDSKGTPPTTNQPTSQTRAVIFSLEEDNGMKILQSWTNTFINDCQLISPLIITKDEDWRPDVEKSPIVIFYSSSSMSSIEKMKSHMENIISRKGHQAVIVVIGDIQEDSEKIRSQLGISRYPECELHVFTKTDWLLQDPRLQEMEGKIKPLRDYTLRDPLPGGSQKMTLNKQSNDPKASQNSKNGATFFIRDTTQEKSHWLEPVLKTNDKVDFTVTEISKIKKLSSKVKEMGPISGILHFNKETFHKMIKMEISGATAIDGKILKHLGNKAWRVVVVVDDVDDDGSEQNLRALYNKTQFSRSAPLVVFRREEKQEEFLAYFSSNNDTAVTAREKWSKLQKSIEARGKAPESCLPSDAEKMGKIRNFTTVGIFSRSSNVDYSWMENMLKSPDLHLPVSGVRSFCISNNQTIQIIEELKLCTFGILYHTKNRGRVNVTDVTDSLYDEELKTMSLLLGWNNVIVVVDDLMDNRLKEKIRILESQPSIKTYAYNLLLVTEKEKKDEPRLLERLREALMFNGEEKDTDCVEPVEEENISHPEGIQFSNVGEKSPSQQEGNQPTVTGSNNKTTELGENQSTLPVDENSTLQHGGKQPIAPGRKKRTSSQQGDKQSAPLVDEKSPLQQGDNQSAPPVDEKSPSQQGDNQSELPVDEKSTSQPIAPARKKRITEPGDDQMKKIVEPLADKKQPEEHATIPSRNQPPAVTTRHVTSPPETNGKNDTNENVSKSEEKVSNSEGKLKSESDPKKKPNSKQDPQEELKSERDSKKEPESKQDSEKRSDINQDSGNDQMYITEL